ncbi:N-alpha-acetyltransferase 35, NatC auxiliary subunit [Aspergillus clavatus NRRL 1]|uniref:Amino-acid N-acetyltransferase subunit Mak10, putative n=1 Tax=Aspergillus clavatus (strain ATCC 1007 / CBS 513.65 / DSM 816 / NCTC 3887 / NRRL 1 / QM 1276 / 107) TaxID=344612 RepID=A1CSZ0_ASPCL|nr:amino-acid N-acetyltransferase subunit Mak10, putative [Aspergillus clavatus NRRL 1]EAW06427.1 amino-acid N-acetyltransferase subunit Mak10, putative [Aspergillus clavatus NRRL 1]
MLSNNELRGPVVRVVSQSVKPRDITDEFTQAASKLCTGQLVKDEYFTLFEAVGALEIMDSRMDSGFLGPGENHAQALEDDYDITQELAPEQIVGIMDELLCHEMAWHMGHPLSQTLFTSLYLDKLLWPVPKTLEDARFNRGKPGSSQEGSDLLHLVLRAYCLALAKCCDFVHSRVANEFYYEEEDFVTQLYNRSLLSQFDVEYFQDLLDRAISWTESTADNIDSAMRDAIKHRLLLRRELLLALEGDVDIIEAKSTGRFESCLSQLPFLAKSVSLGRSVPEAFSLKIQRRLASTVPPRPMVNISSEDALAHLRRLCQDAIDLQELLEYGGPHNFKVALWTLLSRKPQPSVYIRSLAQAIIVNDITILGTMSAKQFLYDELSEFILSSSLLLEANTDDTEMPSDPRFQIAQRMDSFVKRFAQPFIDTFRSACLNRCRIRRTLCHTIVDWDNLQMEAEDLDEQLRTLSEEPPLTLSNGDTTYSYPLSSWTYHQKLSQFRSIIQLGFELSIYAPEELAGMYWYLSHICSTHLAHLDRIRTFMVAAAKRNITSSAAMKQEAAERQSAFHRSLRLLERLTTHIVAIDAFAISLHALYVLLTRHNLLRTASGPGAYSSERLRYEIRMKPFLPINLPELVPYEEYRREAILEGDSDEIVLERASKAVAEARKAWEATLANGAFMKNSRGEAHQAPAIEEDWKRDVKDTMRACIGASIAIETVKKALAAQTEHPRVNLQVNVPEVSSKARWHDWWAVPQVSPIKPSSKP